MNNSIRLVVQAFLLIAFIASQNFSQSLRCDLVGIDTTINGKPGKSCLDVSAIRNKTIVIPSNVTRLDNDGLALCQSSLQTGGSADIAYVYDNSGSMNGAYFATSGPDTSFFYDTTSCTNVGVSKPTANIQVWNAAGTALISKTMIKLSSNSGCKSFSGDPYNVRGRAYRLAINNQGARAPQSSAGIMSFTSNIANKQFSLVLTPANITTITGRINAVSGGGTIYTVPLDTSRTWLTSETYTSQTPGRSKAIIFLSDGQPNNTNYLPLNPTTPPIYGIFLGRDTVGTGRLRELSTLTAGQFFLIPSDNPDSLVSVVNRILNIIFLQYNPTQVILTNNTIAPAQTSTSTGLLIQGDSISWRVVLDSVVGLGTNATNNMALVNTFTEKTSGQIIRDTVNFGLSTTGSPAGGTVVINPYRLVTRCFPVSKLQWQTNAGVRPAYFIQADSGNVRLRLRNSDSSLAIATSALNTKQPTVDNESGILPRTTIFPDSSIFTRLIPMSVSATPISNGVLQPKNFDSLISAWVHPRDPQDFARDTIPVRPAQVVASVWFSTTSGGVPVSGGSYPPTTPEIWVVVEDNELTPGLNYRITVSSDSLGGDNVVLNLTPIPGQPGKFTVQVPFSVIAVKTPGDATLQISPAGDLLHAVYIDPFYGDRAEAAAGFGISVQEPPTLVFTDAAGVALADSALWSMATGRVYIKYSDDNSPLISAKPIQFNVASLKLGVTANTDVASLNLGNTLAVTQTLRSWSDNFPTAEALVPTLNNGTLEGAYRMFITATVLSHNNLGVATGQTISRTIVLAHPDTAPSMTYVEHVNSINPRGPVDVIFTLRDQDFVLNAQDTVVATPTCPASGDSVGALRFIQTSPGVYVSDTLFRNGNVPNLADRLLSCPSGGDLVLRYTDEVYGVPATWTIHETAIPIFDPGTSNFVSQTNISITSATPAAQIVYTQNGSLPTPGGQTPYTTPFLLIASDTLEAIASLTGYLRSWVNTANYIRQPKASQIVILDANGNSLPSKVVTDAATALKIKVITSQGGLSGVQAGIFSEGMNDKESPFLQDPPLFDGQVHSFSGNIILRGGASVHTDNNDSLETKLPDTLIATWRNPLNAADVVFDTVIIQPSYTQSQVCFSAVSGDPCVTQFNNGTTEVFVRVVTRTGLPGIYNVTVTSGPSGGFDLEGPYNLSELTPGSGIYYSGSITLNENIPKTSSNNSIQVTSTGDQITANFIHPVLKDTTKGVAGYGQPPESPATVVFLSSTGQVLPNNSYYNLSNDSVRVRYTDDWSSGINNFVKTKTLNLLLNVLRSGIQLSADTEMVVGKLVYDTTTKVWFGAVALKDLIPISGNGRLESQFRGELAATVASHNNTGNPDGNNATATLVIAYPDQPATIDITNTRGGDVGRLTDTLKIVVHDQIFSTVPGTKIAVRVSCQASGDHEDLVWLISNGDGTYSLVPPMPKDEIQTGTPTSNNGKLSCRTSDIVRVDYIDPVYGTGVSKDVGWSTPNYLRIYYARTSDTSVHITSFVDGSAPNFSIIVEATSPNRDAVDTLTVVMTTVQGEKETVKVIETGINTGFFKSVIPCAFSLVAPITENKKLDARLIASQTNTSVLATGTVTSGTSIQSGDILLISQFHQAIRGYVRDGNGDGQADSVFIVFSQKLGKIASDIDTVYWNAEGLNRKTVAANKQSLSTDSLTLILNLASSPFPLGVTNDSTPSPKVYLPRDGYFGGVHVTLIDSVGPVPLVAIKSGSDLRTEPIPGTIPVEYRFKPDTLRITVSEPMNSANNWNGIFRYAPSIGNCQDSTIRNGSVPIPTLSEPTATNNNKQFELLVNLGRITTKNCIYLERDGRFVDQHLPNGNIPGKLGVEVNGTDSKPYIGPISGYPPVAGLIPGTGNRIANNITDIGRNIQTGTFVWIPPLCFPKDYKPGDKFVPTPICSDTIHGRTQNPTDVPRGLGIVQVITATSYIADVNLYDHLGHFVKKWQQRFGFNGELANPNRIFKGDQGVRSYLVWDTYDSKGQLAGQGVYVWKINFTFQTGKREIRLVRTGLVRTQ